MKSLPTYLSLIGAMHIPVLAATTIANPGPVGRPSAGGAYSANATIFDGTDYIERDADLTGNADGLKGSFAAWVKFTGGNGVFSTIYTTQGGGFTISKQAGNTLRIQINGTDADMKIRINQTTSKVAALTDSSGWTWIGSSWDNTSAGGVSRLYMANASTSWAVTEALDAGSTLDQDSVNLDYAGAADQAIGAQVGGSSAFTGELCEFWMDLSRQIDWSSGTEQAKFYTVSGTGKPTDLTGIYTPIIWLKSAAASFTTNSGSGGNFVLKSAALTTGTPP